MSGITKESL